MDRCIDCRDITEKRLKTALSTIQPINQSFLKKNVYKSPTWDAKKLTNNEVYFPSACILRTSWENSDISQDNVDEDAKKKNHTLREANKKQAQVNLVNNIPSLTIYTCTYF